MNAGTIPKLRFRPMIALFVVMGILTTNFLLIQATDVNRMRQENFQTKRIPAAEMERRLDAFNREFDLDQPVMIRFGRWLKRVFTLDFGQSMSEPTAVTTIIFDAFRNSLWLQLSAFLLYFLVGIPLGVFLAKLDHSKLGRILDATILAAYAMPTFWLATLLLIYAASESGVTLFPLEGLQSPGAEEWGFLRQMKDRLWHMVLPVAALSIPGIAVIARQTRSAMLTSLAQDYVLAAKASGVSQKKVLWGHALRNSLMPVATLFGLLIPQMLGGSVMVEKIFNIHGLGLIIFQSALERDFPVLQAVVLLTTLISLLGFVVADLLTRFLDPKLRVS